MRVKTIWWWLDQGLHYLEHEAALAEAILATEGALYCASTQWAGNGRLAEAWHIRWPS